MPTYQIINKLENDIKSVLKDINLVDSPNHADEAFVDSCCQYIRIILSEIYEKEVINKYLYDEILSQFVYHHFGDLLYDNPFHFMESEEHKTKLKNRVKHLKNIPQMEQRSEEWYQYRNCRITASDFSSIFGKNVFKSKNQLLREKIDPTTINFIQNDTMLHGTRLEDAICQIYQNLENTKIEEFGCLSHDTIVYLGASPDGIDENGVMLEIKCPPKRIMKGIPPVYYWCQIQLQLEVADLNRCDYMECKIEVISKDAFKQLLKRESRYRQEAGCLIECWNYKENKLIHDYFPVGNNLNEVDKWENTYLDKLENQDNLDYRNTIYWHTKEMAKTTIYRDYRWFERAKDTIEEFWDDVLEGREALKLEQSCKSETSPIARDNVSRNSNSSCKSSKKSACLIINDSDIEMDD